MYALEVWTECTYLRRQVVKQLRKRGFYVLTRRESKLMEDMIVDNLINEIEEAEK